MDGILSKHQIMYLQDGNIKMEHSQHHFKKVSHSILMIGDTIVMKNIVGSFILVPQMIHCRLSEK